MNTLKTVVVIAVLAIVGYGLYVGLNNGFQFQNGAAETPDWLTAEMAQPGSPDIQLGTESSTPPTPGAWGGASPPATPVAPQQFPVAAVPSVTPGTANSQVVTSGAAAGPSAPLAGVPASAATMPPGAADSLPPTAATAMPGAPAPATPHTHPQTPGSASATSAIPLPPPQDAAAGAANQAVRDPNAAATQSSVGQPVDASAGAGGPLSSGTGRPAATATDTSAFQAAMRSAQEQLRQGQLAAALLTLSIWYEDPRVDAAQHEQLVGLLDQVAGTVIYSRKHLIEAAYSVKPGERLEDVARQYNVPAGVLAKINGIDPAAVLTAGQQLKVVRGPFNAVVDTKKQTLTLWVGGRYAGRFAVHVGPEFEQIVGPFVVTNKTREHTAHGGLPWVELGSGFHATGGPGNQAPRLGIAGVRDPAAAVGTHVPGRIAVSSRDADDLFDILSQGSKVTIQR